MSLYTPVFPSLHESDSSRKGPPENSLTTTSGKKQNYVEFIRDVHLFLSTQSDMLSPPSRPSSPFFDRRVQKVKDEVRNVFKATEDDAPSGMWTRVSQTLKLGCVRGRHWSVPAAGPSTPEQNTNWILPDEESEWIDWEKKREESRRLKAKTNASQRIGTAASSQKTNRASFAGSTQPFDHAHQRSLRDVSPTTMRAAKEKVRKWQASVASEVWHDTTSGSSHTSIRTGIAAAKGKSAGPQRSRTLDFAVVKSAAKSIIDKKEKGSLPRPGIRGGSAPTLLQKLNQPTLLQPASALGVETPVAREASSDRRSAASPAKDDLPKIADIPETPYLPPSFPTRLETSTPLPDSAMIIRTKPSPILPLPAASLLRSTSPDPTGERQLVMAEPHAANGLSCLPLEPPQINAVQAGKRSRAPSTSLDEILNDPSVNPPSKRLRTLSQKSSSRCSNPPPPNEGLDVGPPIQDATRYSNLDSVTSHHHNVNALVMVSGAPSTPGKNDQPATDADAQGLPEKIASPTKSVKSYFSAPASEAGDSPLKANLLLESPVSPMLSYAQNASSFLPLLTSTQVGRESPSADRKKNKGVFGLGYSSQFDVERHVDRVSEMLEKDVDFDGWLQDVRMAETGQD